MGVLESNYKKRKKRQDIKRIVLSTVALAGLLGIMAVAPNAIQALKILGLDPKKRQKEIIYRSRDKLIKQGLLKYENGFVELTEEGKRYLKKVEIKNWKIEKPKKWDGRWRMLIFDIPEKKRRQRDLIRFTLINIGFLMIQKSVWIYPYDCEDYVNLLKANFKIGKNLLYLIVDSLENDKNFRLAFNLPKYT